MSRYESGRSPERRASPYLAVPAAASSDLAFHDRKKRLNGRDAYRVAQRDIRGWTQASRRQAHDNAQRRALSPDQAEEGRGQLAKTVRCLARSGSSSHGSELRYPPPQRDDV